MLNHLCRGHFFIHCDQMSELAGRDLHLDVWPQPLACSRSPGSIPPRCRPLDKHRWGTPAKSLVWMRPPPFSRAQHLRGEAEMPPTDKPHALPHPRHSSAHSCMVREMLSCIWETLRWLRNPLSQP